MNARMAQCVRGMQTVLIQQGAFAVTVNLATSSHPQDNASVRHYVTWSTVLNKLVLSSLHSIHFCNVI